MYLADAPPWIPPRQDRFRPALAALMVDHRTYVDRLAAMILDLGGQPDLGGFPTTYTDLHDLAAEFLLDRLVCELRAELSAVGRAVGEFPEDTPARQLVDEIRGNLQGHLDIWDGLARAGGAIRP
jgi:hypothetical protein